MKDKVQTLTLVKLEDLKILKKGQIVLLSNEGWWVLGTFDSLEETGINIRVEKGIHWSDLTKMNAVYLFLGGTFAQHIAVAKEQLLKLILEKNLVYF
jgi:hypothetical protein